MIQKITNEEYLGRLASMSLEERRVYLERVGEWCRTQSRLLAPKMNEPTAVFQNVLLCGAGWNDKECRAWSEGVVLLTALMPSEDTWLPDMLYTKAAKRSIRQMLRCLTGVAVEKKTEAKAAPAAPAAVSPKETAGVSEPASAEPAPATIRPLSGGQPVPTRPTHIDQYVHLLPQKTQERAANIKGLLRDLDVARENMRLLMNDPHADANSRASWAKTATKLDDKVKAVYRELDAEWEKLAKSGRVVVDDLGNARVVEAAAQNTTKKQGRPPLTDEQKAAKAAEKEEAKKADGKRKAALLRKFLIDTRNAKTEEQQKKWISKYKEMVKLGGEDSVTPKVLEAAVHYGITVDGASVCIGKADKE